MSAGKHTIYRKKICSSEGLNQALTLSGGNGTATGSGPVVQYAGHASLGGTAAIALTAAQHYGHLSATPTAGRAWTTLTGAQLDAAFPDMPIGGTFKLTISNLAAATHAITLTAGASGVVVTSGAVAAATSKTFTVVRAAAEQWRFQ